MEYAIWIVFIVAMLVIEASTTNLVTIWFAVGALGAIVARIFGAAMVWQVIIMVILSGVTLIVTRPYIKRYRNSNTVPTNADRLIGDTGFVTEDITPDKFAGKVNVAGREWSAVSNDKTIIPTGTQISIKSISGVKLVVEKIEKKNSQEMKY